MKTIFLFAKRDIKTHPSSFFKTSLMCFICSLLITCQFNLINNYIIFSKTRINNTYGTYTCLMAFEDFDSDNTLEKVIEYEKIGNIKVYSPAGSNHVKSKSFFIGTADETSRELNHIYPLNGKMPEAKDEIAIEQSTLNLFFPDAKVGDVIRINNLVDSKDKSNAEKEFTLSAILSDYSKYQWKTEKSEYFLPNAIVSSDNALVLNNKALFSFVPISAAEDSDKNVLLSSLNSVKGLIEIQENHSSEASISSFLGIDETFLGIIYAFLTIFVTVFMLYSLSVSKKFSVENRIGILKLGGFSVSDLKKFFTLKTFIEAIPSSLFGSVFGAVISCYLVKIVFKNEFVMNVYLNIISTILSTFLICFVLLHGINSKINKAVCENLDSYGNIKSITRKSNFTSDNPAVLYAVKSYNLRPDSSSASAIMILFSIVVLYLGLFASSSIAYIAKNRVSSDYTVMVADGWCDRTGYIPFNPFVGLTAEDHDLLFNCNDVDRIISVKDITMFITNKDNTVDMTKEEKIHFGFSQDIKLNPISLTGINTQAINTFLKYRHEGTVTPQQLKSGKYVIALKNEHNSYRVGDVLSLTQALVSNESIRTVTFNVTVAATIDKQDIPPKTMESLAVAEAELLWNESAFEKVNMPLNYKYSYIGIKEPSNVKKINSILDYIIYTYTNSSNDNTVNSNATVQVNYNLEERTKLESISDSFAALSKISGIALMIFSLFGLAVNLSLRIMQRKKILGTLRACGLTIKDYMKISVVEILLETGIPIVIGNIIAFSACIIINNSIFSVPINLIPIGFMLIFSIIYLIFSIIVSVTSAIKLFKIPVSECINDNG